MANRPGFPFLGNDFFREAGDCFSVHVVQNPPQQTMLEMLRAYAPNEERVPQHVLRRLEAEPGYLAIVEVLSTGHPDSGCTTIAV